MNAYSKIKSSLALKLITPILVIGLLILIGFKLFFVFFTQAIVNQQANEKASDITDSIIIAIEADADKASAQRVISALTARKNVVRLSLVEAESKLIVADNRHENIGILFSDTLGKSGSSALKALDKTFKITATATQGSLHFQRTKISLIKPSINRSRPYYIYVIYDKYNELANIAEQLLILVLIFTVGIIALASAVYLIQKKILTSPLKAINQAIKQHDINTTTSSPIIHQSNDELGLLVCSYNELISELEQRAQSLEKKSLDLIIAKEKAEIATKAKSDFLACMSHELRTPINGVLGMLKLIENTNLSDAQRHKTKLIRLSSESLLYIVNDILDFSKVEAGKLEINAGEVDLLSLLSDFTESISYRAKEKKTEIILDVSEINHPQLLADPVRLQQILYNVVGNAIKFTENGEILIVGKTTLRDNKVLATLSVIDTGIGIPEEKLDSVFEPFTQVDSSNTRKHGGTGLGLAITKDLCQLMNGDIGVQSEVGKGSRFDCELELEAVATKTNRPLNTQLEGNKVLVLDKNPTSQTAICNLLLSRGASATSYNATQGLQGKLEQLLLEKKYNALILDYDCLGLKTPKLLKTLRQDKRFKHLNIILMVELENINLLHDIDELKLSAVFPKPATYSHLMQSFDKIAENSYVKNRSTPTNNEDNLKNKLSREKPIRILLVEDNIINQTIVVGLLEEIGLNADVANNGKEALEALKQKSANDTYQLILMDCQMPVMDGFEATKAIRKGECGEGYTTTPIIAITANAMRGDREKCLAAGMSEYLSKPVDAEKFYYAVNHWGLTGDRKSSARENTAKQDHAVVAIWDKTTVLQRVGNKEERLKELVSTFLKSMPELFENLELSIEEGNPESIRYQAHGVKGVAGNLSAMEVMEIAKEIEIAAKVGDLNRIDLLTPKLNNSASQLEKKLKDYVAN